MRFISLVGVLLLISGLGLAGCGGNASTAEKPTLTLADAGWDSIQFHNSVVQFIVEKGYGYKTDVTSASTVITFEGLINGDIDIYTETWTDNFLDLYNKALQEGSVKELSVNFDDNRQGFFVPTYLIKGDPARGIEPLAPNLKSVTDLPQYWELFKDPESPSKGRIYGSIPGWAADEIMSTKVKSYGLDNNYTYFSPGSDTALSTSIVEAYESGEPWVGYYWEPTWLMNKYDMTLLEEVPFDEALWNDGYKCYFRPCPVTVSVHKDLETTAPEVCEFLKHYKTSTALTNEALDYMETNKAKPDAAAKWFLTTHDDLWTSWVSSEVADKVKAAL